MIFFAVYLLTLILSVSAGQQYFRVQPHDVKVREGGEAMLECEVGMLAGAVQWTKDGFALGKFRTVFHAKPVNNGTTSVAYPDRNFA